MLAYNGSVPGPTLKVTQGATITVHVTNDGDLEATVHWHGLRLENRYDGTHDTQAPIPVGETLHLPGARCPIPAPTGTTRTSARTTARRWACTATSWPPRPSPTTGRRRNRELLLTLDDILIEDGQIAAFSASETTHVAMGRFGNVMLVAGEPDLRSTPSAGEVVRLYLTNTANTRVFNVTLPGAQMKLVGGDSGHYEHEELVDEVLLAPSERVVVDVLFDEPGELELEHQTPERTYRSRRSPSRTSQPEPAFADAVREVCAPTADMAELASGSAVLDGAPDKTLAFVAEMDMGVPEGVRSSTSARCIPRS